MKLLVVKSWLLLVYFDWIIRFREFHALYRIVQDELIHPTPTAGLISSEVLCRAMDYACVFYFKRVHCLQRSSATTLLLRRHGWKAEMVIGV
jgi:Transglutaminase-like superfamily